MVTERSRSVWISVGERRHSVIRVVTSPLPGVLVVAAAISAEVRSVVVAALPVVEVAVSVEEVEVDGVVVVEDELEGVLEAMEPLPLSEPEAEPERLPLVVDVELSREVEAFDESDATVELLLGEVDEALLGEVDEVLLVELGLLVEELLKPLLDEALGVVAAMLLSDEDEEERLLCA
jgi:hypothetical protein